MKKFVSGEKYPKIIDSIPQIGYIDKKTVGIDPTNYKSRGWSRKASYYRGKLAMNYTKVQILQDLETRK